MPQRLIHRAVQFRQGEAPVAWLMFAYSFLAMTAYNVLKPISKSKFIVSFGADNLPYIQLAAGALIGLLMLIYTWAIARLPRRSIVPATLGPLAGVTVLFWLLFRTGGDWVSAAFFVFNVMLGILLISQFWTLANEIYDARQARRLFGFIGGGASLGGALGAAITAWTVAHVGLDNLLLVSALSLGLCVAIVTLVVRRQPPTEGDAPLPGVERGVGPGEAVRLLAESRHLQVISLVIACAALGAAVIDQQLAMAAADVQDTDAGLTSLLAEITFYLSLVSFVVQVGLTSRIHRSLGLTVALIILPMGLGVSAVAILATGALWATAAAKVLDSSLRYSLDKTTREVLFLPLPPDLKVRAKAFIDVTMDRLAKAAGNLLALVLIKPWGLGLDWVRLSYASLAILALWVGMAIVARREYVRSFRRSLHARVMEPDTVRIAVADQDTLATLVDELSSTDEPAVLYAIAMLETLGHGHRVTPAVLQHESAAVRARALAALGSAGATHEAERWIPAVRALVADEDAGVRAAALRALAALGDADSPAILTRHLDDPDPAVAVTAAAELADSGRPPEVAAAHAALSRLIADEAGPAFARREAARALARIRNPEFRSLLIPLIHDADLDVAAAAVASAQSMGPSDALFVPALVSRLGHRVLKRPAREALVSYGAGVVPALAHLLADPHEQLWVRRHIPGTLARIPVQASMDALCAVAADPDGFMRYKIVTAIEALHCRHPELALDRAIVERLIWRESARYYTYLTLRENLIRHDQGDALVVRALDDKLGRTLDRLYRELGLLYPWKDVAAARRTIEAGDAHARAAALEFLDTLLTGTIRTRVMPILDDMPIADKVRHANSVLKTRPRDLEDTLAQLVHDEDPVLAASAIELVVRRGIDALAGDLEFITGHGTAERLVLEAARWALAERAARQAGRRVAETGPLPVVRVADRLRELPLFSRISVDELFRVAATARQCAHDRGRPLARPGTPATEVLLLIEGTVTLAAGDEPGAIVAAPAALALEEALGCRSVRRTIAAAGPVVCLSLTMADLLTMLSDNIAMAQGLFRTLLPEHVGPAAVSRPAARGAAPAAPPAPLNVVDKARLLRQNPILGNASVEQLLALSAVTREVALAVGAQLPADREGPALYHLLAGEVQLEGDGSGTLVMGPGRTVFVAETLTGATPTRRATVTREGHALRLDHEELFEVLADHTDLLRGVFSGVLGFREMDR